MQETPKKRRNFEQGQIDGFDRKMKKIGLIIRYSRCKQIFHIKSTCNMIPTTQPIQISQARASEETQGSDIDS